MIFRRLSLKQIKQISLEGKSPALNKVVMQLHWNHTSALMLSCKYAEYFQTNFVQEHVQENVSINIS